VLNGFHRYSVAVAALVIVTWSSVAGAQSSPSAQPSNERHSIGTLTNVGRGSIVLQTDEGQYQVFTVSGRVVGMPTLDQNQIGARVRVTTASTDTDPAPAALAIDKLPPREGLAPQSSDPVPANVRQLSASIERQARKYRAGVSLGAALDPELISIDGFMTLAPFRNQGLNVRPALELAFGEVTTLFGLHFDVLFGIPGVKGTTRWAPYFGAGPSFSFSHRGIAEEEFISGDAPPPTTEEDDDDEDRFDFSQYNWDSGFNFIVGARSPGGTFFELKATAYGVASIRMLGGFEF
jgi:hypothetical protein